MTVGCGTIEHNELGLENLSKLIVRSESLVGAKIYINEKLVKDVKQKDLVAYKKGILGVSDRENEKLEAISFEVEEGYLAISIYFENNEAFNKNIYIGKGQTREVRINK
jgi:hypothetical protein